MRRLLASSLFLAVGCAKPRSPDLKNLEGLKYGPECAEARRRAGNDSTLKFYAPVATAVPILPLYPIPQNVKGSKAVVTIQVDSVGNLLAVVVSGLRNREYATRIQQMMVREARFRPARTLDGCAISGKATVGFEF